MGDIFQTGAAWLASQKKAHASQTVTYSRNGVSVSVQAELGKAELEVTGSDGQPKLEIYAQAFWINVADLVLGSTAIEPERGDRVTFGGQTFQVNFPGNGGQPFLHDAHKTRYKVFCKKIG